VEIEFESDQGFHLHPSQGVSGKPGVELCALPDPKESIRFRTGQMNRIRTLTL
jgi:hypothetical protein